MNRSSWQSFDAHDEPCGVGRVDDAKRKEFMVLLVSSIWVLWRTWRLTILGAPLDLKQPKPHQILSETLEKTNKH